jgi:hypothetical protein
LLAGDLTIFFLIWPYDATRPDVFHDGAGISFWLYAALAVAFTGLALLAFRQLSRAARVSRVAPIEASAGHAAS